MGRAKGSKNTKKGTSRGGARAPTITTAQVHHTCVYLSFRKANLMKLDLHSSSGTLKTSLQDSEERKMTEMSQRLVSCLIVFQVGVKDLSIIQVGNNCRKFSASGEEEHLGDRLDSELKDHLHRQWRWNSQIGRLPSQD